METFPEKEVPVLATGDVFVFPGATVALMVQNERNLRALQRAEMAGGWIVALAQREHVANDSGPDGFYRIGTIGRIKHSQRVKKNLLQIVFEGEERYQILGLEERDGCYVAAGAALPDRFDIDDRTLQSLCDGLRGGAIEILELMPVETERVIEAVKGLQDPRNLSYSIAQYLNLPKKDAQELLEIVSIKNRLLRLLEMLATQRESLKVQLKIRETLSESMGKKQREVLLREQMKAIQDELGDNASGPSGDDYRKKIDECGMPEEAKQVALREASRLERMGDQSAESHVIRNYLDLLCDMPWSKTSDGEIDLGRAEEVLHRDHYGLEKIKRRILEHLAVMKLRKEKRGSILLFVGPPGVGKTSLGKSIAEAIGREFVRVSLGGVRDDADIRGHRRTYVGALPGRIIDGIRRAKTKDPVFVLDEIDKLGHGWGGDPASALLEVLDPEQNMNFHDHYLDVPFDLSQVLFIGTANTKETVPGPLLDRMEVIDLSGYTTDEKFHIAKSHLLPLELELHGLQPEQLTLEDAAVTRVIEGYTREAGVRSLRRELARICRAAAIDIAKSPETAVVVDAARVGSILGPSRFELEELGAELLPGVVTGMAWTPVGGDVLFVEAAMIPGEGKLLVTGQLGDVMKESSQIAVSLARVRLEGIAKQVLYKDRDIHLHVPGGAIPKDGPSAGVTLFTSVASMMLGLPVNPKLAMTGEVTLRGKVLPVGGIKEKVLAAARSGVTEVVLPKGNAKDLADIPEAVRLGLNVQFVSNVDELLQIAFGELPKGASIPEVLPGVCGELHH